MHVATRIASITVLAAALAGCGITAPKSNPGYADLDSPGVFGFQAATGRNRVHAVL